jgi:hypothetical protein
VQQLRPDAAGSVRRMHRKFVEPGALAEAQRVDIQVDRAEADDGRVEHCDEGGAAGIGAQPEQPLAGRVRVPVVRDARRRLEQPVARGDDGIGVIETERPDRHIGVASVHHAFQSTCGPDKC